MVIVRARALIIMSMVIRMKVTGKITKDMEKESTNALQRNSKFVIHLLRNKLTMIYAFEVIRN